MRRRLTVFVATALAVALLAGSVAAFANGRHSPKLKRQPTPAAVVQEHLDALNHCDLDRLMAQYPPDVQIFLPAGQVVSGQADVLALFEGFCKPHAENGFAGITFTSEIVKTVGGTVSVQWVATAPFMKPYRGADAYITRHGLMAAQVTTFGAPAPEFTP
jgi:ketosteroid isomerase-like protein